MNVQQGPAADADLFGPDPGADPLAWYAPPDPAADIFRAAPEDVAKGWRTFAAGLAVQGQGDLGAVQAWLDRHVDDLGLAFRLTGDEHERPWPLNPMPILIGADEWAGIEAGLVQRAGLLEAVIADVYGPQRLIADGHLPPAVISGSAQFARRMAGVKPPGGHYLHVLAIDLARGPTGEWRVLADRVRLPVGIGYALENRLALGRATGGLLASVGTRRQAPFFDALRQGIAANCRRADPRIGLLTPGRFNQSYPEQAHLARQLGFSLVEGRDLTVLDGRLYVRTIAGLKRMDALWRWIGTRDIDPLNFDARSRIGVPDLVAACEDGLVLANWPGVGVLESRAMPAFLPRLARILLGEPLRLPNAATWWCGGEAERRHVLENLDRLVISSAFCQPVAGLPDGKTRPGASLSPAERAMIEQGMARRAMDYTAQEIVSLSTTPALTGGRFEARGFTLRAFLARDGAGQWVVLPGGFARISQQGDLRTSLMGLGDIATDVCILDRQAAETPDAAAPQRLAVRREQGLLSSQAADNLFWIGRYGERAHQTVRIVRVLIDQVTSGAGASGTAIATLTGMLRKLGAVPASSTSWAPARIASAALGDAGQAGSVRALARRGREIALLLRDRLNRDSWRAIQRPMPRFSPGDPEAMAGVCDRLVERFAALVRLTADGMSRGPAWRFLDMGIALERASMVVQAAQAVLAAGSTREDLAALLDLVDGQALYRSRYMAEPQGPPVLDLVLLDPVQPRGVAHQVVQLEDHLAALPPLREDGMVEAPLRIARHLRAMLEGLEAEALDLATLEDLRRQLMDLSDAIASRFFLQEETPSSREQTGLLA